MNTLPATGWGDAIVLLLLLAAVLIAVGLYFSDKD